MADTVTCPTLRDGDDDVARQFANGALSPAAAREFEAHMVECHRCQKAVEYAAGVTATLRGAAKSTEPSPWANMSWPVWTISAVVVVGVAIVIFVL
jgi:anti-sigma factor ChrR (cupin superfamily)